MISSAARARPVCRGQVLALAAIGCALAFAPAYGLYRFHDDWRFVERAADAVAHDAVASFVARPFAQHWSPAWHAIETANFLVAGWEGDWFIRTINLGVLFAALCLIAWLLRASGVGTAGLVVGMGVLAAHHATAVARYSFDTYSQTLSDLAVWSVAVMIGGRLVREEPIVTRDLLRACGVIAVALLVKEQALGGMVVMSLLLLIAAAAGWSGVTWRRAFPTIAAMGVLAAAFAIVRRAMGVSFDSAGDAAFRLCPECVPVNVGYLLAGLLVPIRTIVVFDAWTAQPRAMPLLVLVAAVGLTLVGCVGAGLWRAGRASGVPGRRVVAVAIAGLAASWFPVALLGRVGELYAHTGVFWWSMLVAVTVDALWLSSGARRRAATAAAATVYVTSLAVGLLQNLGDMRATGERARQHLDRIAAVTAAIPDEALVVVRSPEPIKRPGDYALYRLTSPQVLVMTGLSPASVRYATGGRLRVLHEAALTEPMRMAEVVAAGKAGRLHEVVLEFDRAWVRAVQASGDIR